MIVNPFTKRNLQSAAQVGVEEIVLTYQGPGSSRSGRAEDGRGHGHAA
jgi:hypothetical protein